jgi:asparagine synthase (glutamine-hydrolysing)
VDFLPQLNGWFSGVIIDKRKGRIVLFNDRYGVGRICYHQGTDAFYFASEAKSLLAVLPQTRTLDPIGLGEHLACGAVLQNRTLFKGISLVPPGSAWTFHLNGTVDMSTYFSPRSWEEQPVLTEQEYYARFKDVWTRRLPYYFGGSRPIALSLTGGVDSRMILAWRSCASGRLLSYTFGGKYRECRDVILARRLAALSNTPHSVIPLDETFLQQFPTLAETAARVSDGTLDASGAVDIFVQGLAREIAPVRVTGTNGGEILRRLVAFGPEPLDPDIFSADFIRVLEKADETYRAELDCHRLSFTAFKQVPVVHEFEIRRRAFAPHASHAICRQ